MRQEHGITGYGYKASERRPYLRTHITMPLCLLVVFMGVILRTYRPTAAEPGEQFLYKPDFLCFTVLTMFPQVHRASKKLYCCCYEGHPSDWSTGRGRNIVTRWDLKTGKREVVAEHKGFPAFINQVSPGGSWLLLSASSFAERKTDRKNLSEPAMLAELGLFSSLFSSATLQCQYTWSHPTVMLPAVQREIAVFLDDSRLAFLLEQFQKEDGQYKYTVAVWSLVPQISEEMRFPLLSLQNHLIHAAKLNQPNQLLLLASEPNTKEPRVRTVYLVIYDLKQKSVHSRWRIMEVEHSSPKPNFEFPVSILAADRISGRTLLSYNDTIFLHEPGKPLMALECPRDFNNQPLNAVDLSPEGKYVAFESTRIVLYHVDERKYRVLDTSIENILRAWDNPPLFSPLAQVVHDPVMAALMPLKKRLMGWRLVTFLGNGDKLLGITTYGKAVVWDAASGKQLLSFKVAKTNLGADLEQILGLD
ncbi:MAG: hypothetical protein NZ914_07210 [Gemmatales bacterium]|nr:hypothetical protein [Gemmatales bacterium]